jgi:hypothetical protein
MILTGNGAKTGPLIIAFFILLSFGVKASQATKGLSFTMWMFTAVAAAMFYPQLFLSYGSFKTTVLIVPLLQLIMFGMGSQMSFDDFAGVIKVPKGFFGGFWTLHNNASYCSADCKGFLISLPRLQPYHTCRLCTQWTCFKRHVVDM